MTTEHGQVVSFFFPQDDIVAIEPLGGGLVNDTWRLSLQAGKRYILQRLNPSVFADPMAVQGNLLRITKHIHARLPALCHLPHQKSREFILFHPVSNQAGEISYQDSKGAVWRILTYLEQTRSLRSISTPAQAEEIGAALGLFHQLLADLPLDALTDPLPGFHNTPCYLEQYDQTLAGPHNSEAEDCRSFIEQRRKDAFFLENARQQGKLGQQIIHADPKVANFLFSPDKQRVVSLIDLDTVRSGLLLHDIGDCLRSCCNPLGEEVKNPEDILFRRDYFAATVRGYLATAADLLTPEDQHLLVDSAWLISFELGLRFYSDYLTNNCYFKVDHPEQNLFRARIQFTLASSIEQQYEQLCRMIS
jgi:hypothetical protein